MARNKFDPFGNALEQARRKYLYLIQPNRIVDRETGETFSRQAFDAAQTQIADCGKTGLKSAFATFMNSGAQTAFSMSYRPGRPEIYADEDTGEDFFNLWRPSGIEPAKHVTHEDVRPWLDHVDYIFPDETARRMFLSWCAFIVQRPGEKINWAYLLIGKQGVGKDMSLRPIYGIIGHKNYTSVSTDDITGQWTDWAEHQIVVVEELPSFHKRDVYDWLKRFVATGTPHFRVNKKKIAQYKVRNLQNWFIFSNHEDALALEADDRRYFVYASPVEKKSSDYYGPLVRIFDDAAFQSKLYGWLKRYDLAAFDPGEAPPMTEAKIRMLEETRNPVDRWLDEQFDGGKFDGRKIIQASEILADVALASKYGGAPADVARSINGTRAGRWLRQNGWWQMEQRRLPALGRVRLWISPTEPAGLIGQLSPEALEVRYRKDAALTAAGGGSAAAENEGPS